MKKAALFALLAYSLVLALGVVRVFADDDASVTAAPAAGATVASPSVAPVSVDDLDPAALDKNREKFEFQAEVSRLMDIIINSLYQKKEIFLRELISNGSDALDKIRFLSLADDTLLGSGDARNLEIRVSGDRTAKTLTIRDTGVGMTKNDLINNLGTVAKSGTAAFMEQMANGGDVSLIGQFGVGFYSIYLTADRVRVVSKHADDKQYVWESTADGTYTVAEDPRGDTLGRGTEITLYLKDDATEYAEAETLRKLIKRYSEFITFPIYLQSTKMETVEVPVEKDAEATPTPAPSVDSDSDDEEAVEAEDETAAPAKPATKTETKEVTSWELVNDQKAIWQRKSKDISEDEYLAFYKSVTKAAEEPIGWTHFTAEGEVEFRSILYIPGVAPPDLYDNYYAKQSSLKLYVRKVLISDEFEELLPRYLNFIRGLVDSDDLPLNVSREQLQQHKILKVMGKKLVRKVLEMLKKLADDQARAREEAKEAEKDKESASATEDDSEEGAIKKASKKEPLRKGADKAYDKFWETFGKNVKLGLIEDSSNRSKLAKLLRFRSTTTGKDGWRSLEEYVAAMKPGQKQIYFIAGESLDALSDSPFLERLRSKGLEVLLLTDPIDEYAVQNLPEFDNHKLQSISKEGLALPGEEATAKKLESYYKDSFEGLTKYLKKVYSDRVEKVVVSQRLDATPCILVTSQYGYSANMERIMKAQAFADPSRAQFLTARKTLEINPRHPIIVELSKRASADPEAADAEGVDLANLLFDTALLNSGFAIDDTKDFAGRMLRFMKTGLKLESLELVPEPLLPLAPEAEDSEEGEDEDDSEEAGEEEASSDDKTEL